MAKKLVRCGDCQVVFEFEHRVGTLPKRCLECRQALQRARRRRWYQENREYVLAYAVKQWRASHPATEQTKTCLRCGDEFSCSTRAARALYCKPCRQVRARERNQAHKEQNRDRLRAENRDYAQKRREDDPGQRERERLVAAAFRAANPERAKEIRKRSYWKHAESRRSRRREHQVRHRMAIYERDEGMCHICEEHVPIEEFEIDHIFPVSRGGLSDSSNLAVSHMRCNRRKAARVVG